MPSSHAQDAAEFEVLVRRSIRRGYLDAAELAITYARLNPRGHTELDNPRRLDLPALVNALTELPREFFTAPLVAAVARLHGFTHTPVAATTFAAGLTPDGTLLLEVPHGFSGVARLAAILALLAHEQSKALDLTQTLRDRSGPADGVTLALAWGVDEIDLGQADALTQGRLQALLTRGAPLPEVALHAELEAAVIARRYAGIATAVVTHLAEMGLAHRPLHLWFGSPMVVWCLSPYVRDLRQQLLSWALTRPAALGADVRAAPDPSAEHILYGVMADLLATDPRLVAEQEQADRTVGIFHQRAAEFNYEVVDLGRVDPTLADVQLFGWHNQTPPPVLLRLPLLPEDATAELFKSLVDALGPLMRSITLVMQGSIAQQPPATTLIARAIVRWGGEELLFLPHGGGLEPAEVSGLTDAPVLPGVVISAPVASLVSDALVANWTTFSGTTAIEEGSAALAATMIEAVWAGLLAHDTDIAWAVIGAQPQVEGRACLNVLAAQRATAIARLRRLFVESAPEAPTTGYERAPEGAELSRGKRPGGKRKMRIRA